MQFAPRWLDREANAKRMLQLAEKEVASGAQLIVFPELANVGYITPTSRGELPSFGPGVDSVDFAVRYLKAAEPVPGPTTELLASLASKHNVYVVLGLAEHHPVIPGTLFNSAALIGPHGIIGVQHKIHIPTNERYHFYPGSTVDVYVTELGNIGLIVCYDAWFPELARVLTLKGAEILCAIHATQTGIVANQTETYRARAIIRARENATYYLLCNRAGKEGRTEFLGHSVIAAPDGEVLAASDTVGEDVISADLSDGRILHARATLSIFRDRRPDMYGTVCQPLS